MFDYYLRATLLETLALVFIATFAFVLWLNYCDAADPPNQERSLQLFLFIFRCLTYCYTSIVIVFLRLFAIVRETNSDTKLQIFWYFSPARLNKSIHLFEAWSGRSESFDIWVWRHCQWHVIGGLVALYGALMHLPSAKCH